MSTSDLIIDADLAALGDASRRDLAVLDGTLRTTGVYRDDRPSAEARRSHLADERRRELAIMPLTLSHLFAHRVGRATAGAAAIACAAMLMLVMADPLLLQLTTWFIPGFAVGMFALLACTTVLGAYVVATWIAEAWFARRMRETIGTSGEVYRDLDQLAEGPFAVAAAHVRRLDRWAIGLPLAGIATLVPALAYVTLIAAVSYTMPYHWDAPSDLLRHALNRNLGSAVSVMAGAVVLAIIVARACDREPRRGQHAPLLVRMLGSGWSALAGLVIAAGMVSPVLSLINDVQQNGILPSEGQRLGFAVIGELAVLLPTTWALLWWRRRERARLGDG